MYNKYVRDNIWMNRGFFVTEARKEKNDAL